MKTNRQRKGKIADAHKGHIGSQGCSGLKKLTNRCRGLHKKATVVLSEVLDQQLPTRSGRETTEVLASELKTGQLNPSMKIKLQLFPIDEGTRIGLEKDGHNPFLELTLRARKKIISVLTHINTKWGSSGIAVGEPMLFPYNVQLGNPAMGRRWTLKDTDIKAADIYIAVERPAIFRLRYGWFSDCEPQSKTPAPFDCLGSESMQKGCSTASGLTSDHKNQIEIIDEQNLIEVSETADPAVIEQISLPVPVDHVGTEAEMDNVVEQSITPWHDDLTNLSIGGLLSEASLQGKPIPLISENSIGTQLFDATLQAKVNGHGSVSNRTNLGPFQWDDGLTALSIGGLLSEASLQGKNNNSDQPETLISDSFDAIIAAQMKNYPQAEKPPSLDSHSSILDAEETCHAFSFRKFSSSGKDARLSGRPSHDPSSSSFRFPKLYEVNKEVGSAEDTPFQESNTEILPLPQVYNEDSCSLGLRGINWNDSLGPFDIGLSKLQQVASLDSMGIS